MESVRYYRTEDDRARHEGYFAWPDLRICTAAKQYDQRQYDLVNLMPAEWFSSDANLKGLAGLLYDKCASFGQAHRTFACIVSAKRGDQFDLPEAMKAFDCGAGNETSLTEDQVHAIAGEANPDAFREWRAEQAKQEAGEQAKQETEAKQQRKDRRKAAASEDEPKSWVEHCEAESKQRKGKKMTQKELKLYTNKDLYAEYVRWTEDSNQKLVNDSTFLQMLDSVGFPLKQKRIKGSDSKPRRRVLTRKLIEENLSQYIVEDEDDEE
ncbi:hypothetical protein PR002_g26093 [Phytophthora rubi]|uniref:Uncharacterized protein n=1 Tax=Phytophthora rubi TaxID=129364 RepID=A0A6A3HVS4_9STRA|nr:hypothetical protein PR002_g26093 [Phytophthora rubi]